MTPAHGAVVVYRLGLGRVLLVVLLVVWLAFRYFIAPVLDGVDRVTPWDGALPNPNMQPWDGLPHSPVSCAPSLTGVRSAGWSGMAYDAGRLIRSIADGPPSTETMVGWFRQGGQGARATWVAFDAGVDRRQLLGTAPTPPPSGSAVDVTARAVLATGLTGDEAATLVAIAGAESGYNPTAANPTSSARGLFQIMTSVHNIPETVARDPIQSAAFAAGLYRQSGWKPWAETHGKGLHGPYMAEARAAVTRAAVPCAAHPEVMQVAAGGSLVEFGRQLEKMGARVREHPEFGGVSNVHRGRGHYEGRAIDVNTRPGTSAQEQAELRPLADLARAAGFTVIFMEAGHYGHMHVEERGEVRGA